MSMKALTFALFLVLSLSLSLSDSASAKPADLPDLNDIQCPDCGEKPATGGSITIGLGLGADGITLKVDITRTPDADRAAVSLLPDLIQQVWKMVQDVWELQGKCDCAPEALEIRSRAAHRLFQFADQLQSAGRFQAARALFQRVHALTPTGRQGRLALDRVQQIDELMRDASEEADHDDSESIFRLIRERTIPLGLVEISF